MLDVWRIKGSSSRSVWRNLQAAPSWEEVFSGLTAFGTIAALDMLDHASLSTRECPTILVKLPEGYPVGLGMVKAFPGVNVDYFRVRGRRTTYSADDILLRDENEVRLGAAAWVMSSVNGENLLARAAIDSVLGRQNLDTIALTHIIVNSLER